MKIKNDTPVSIAINGLELDSTRTYHVLMNDYMANGGDGLDFIIGLNQVSSGKPVRDIILDAIESKTKSGEPITASIENRITIE
jgi:2',3'-cyclic-nucleotide 2'-phosphodiesterase (5'-nucleotidase family)